jgi:hypothetical protein
MSPCRDKDHGNGGEGDANFRREIGAMMTTWAQTSACIHVAAYEASREPASHYFGDDTT